MEKCARQPEDSFTSTDISIRPSGVSVRYGDDPQTNQLFLDAMEEIGLDADDRVLERA